MWWAATPIHVEHAANDDGDAVVVVRMATGGWSGNEELISEIDRTFFSFFYWQFSRRGGLHVYHVPADKWHAPSDLIGALRAPGSTDQPAAVSAADILCEDTSTVYMDGSHLYRVGRPGLPGKCGIGLRLKADDAERLRGSLQWLIDQGYLTTRAARQNPAARSHASSAGARPDPP
jgi:hypothetical protein